VDGGRKRRGVESDSREWIMGEEEAEAVPSVSGRDSLEYILHLQLFPPERVGAYAAAGALPKAAHLICSGK
jgi:hypothetical protein